MNWKNLILVIKSLKNKVIGFPQFFLGTVNLNFYLIPFD